MSCAERVYAKEWVLANRALGPGLFEIATSWSGPPPRPGQFFMVRAARSAVLLGRPLSVYGAGKGSVSFAIAERGEGTRELARLRAGDDLLLEGPLGSSWPSPGADAPGGAFGEPNSATTRDMRRVALVGGGVGLAPLVFLAKYLAPNSYDIYAGYRSAPWGLEGLAPKDLRVFTEDGSAGTRGRVLNGFDPGPYAAIFACGPEAMLRSLAALAKAAGRPAWISLERRMACGVGACLGCSLPTTGGRKRACVEGPVFPAEEVLFDE
jgi:NAD(P)H-flavin reductase